MSHVWDSHISLPQSCPSGLGSHSLPLRLGHGFEPPFPPSRLRVLFFSPRYVIDHVKPLECGEARTNRFACLKFCLTNEENVRILKTLIGHNTRTNQSLQRGTPAQWTKQQSHSALAVLRRRDRRFHLPCAPRLCRGLYGNLLSSVFKSHEKRATLLTLVFHYMHTLPQPN